MTNANTVIFDFDGTLVDSFAHSMKVSNMLAPLFGYRTVGDEEVPSLKKLSAPELFRELGLPIAKLPLILSRARKEIGKEMPSVKLFDGMPAVLEQLKNAGLNLGIVTSNSRRNVHKCLSANGMEGAFNFVHSATNLFGKHRVLKYLMLTKGIRADAVVYVGDESRDIEASKKCKIPVIAVTWGYQDRSQLEQMEPDFLADAPTDIEKFVRGVFKPE